MLAMKYRHTLVYGIHGVRLEAQEEVEVIADHATGFRALLLADPDTHCFEADRSASIAHLLLTAAFRDTESATFDERLASQLEEIRKSRKGKFGKGPYLVLTREDTVEDFTPLRERETDDFVIWLDGVPKERLRQASATQIRAALAALVLGAENVSGIDKISDAVIFFRSDGKPIYSYTASMSGTLSVSQAIPVEAIESVGDRYQSIARRHDLERVNRLLVSSLQTEVDTLRS